MIALADSKTVRTALFLALNMLFVVFLVAFVVAPVLSHFTERSDDIAENTAQLAHFQAIMRETKAFMANGPATEEAFLPGQEERVVSADLQASLISAATAAQVHLLGVRGLPAHRFQQLHMVVVGAELEGSPAAVRDMIVALENQRPFLFVSDVTFRSLADGDGGPIRADLKVQGAMRDREKPSEAQVSE
jgi:hypothetical protein